MIHEGEGLELGCLMLAKNCLKVILDDRKLDETRSDYLAALRDGFLPVAMHLSISSPTSPVGIAGCLASVSESPGYFWGIFASE